MLLNDTKYDGIVEFDELIIKDTIYRVSQLHGKLQVHAYSKRELAERELQEVLDAATKIRFEDPDSPVRGKRIWAGYEMPDGTKIPDDRL